MKRLVLVVIILLGFTVQAYAKGEYKDFFNSLSDDQKKQLKALREQNKEGMKSLHEQMKQYGKELKEAMQTDSPDQSKIDSILEKVSSIRLQIAKKRTANMIAMLKILTPEQRKKFQELNKQMKGKLKGRQKGRINRGEKDKSE